MADELNFDLLLQDVNFEDNVELAPEEHARLIRKLTKHLQLPDEAAQGLNELAAANNLSVGNLASAVSGPQPLSLVSRGAFSNALKAFNHKEHGLSKLIDLAIEKAREFISRIAEAGKDWAKSTLGTLAKKLPIVQKIIMIFLMRQGLLVQKENYTTEPGNHPAPFSRNWYIRTLPPRADDHHYKATPEEIVQSIFARPDGKSASEDNNKSNVIWSWFAQWFVEEFFKTGKTFHPDIQEKDHECSETWSGHQIDLSTLYGENDARTNVLRSHVDGKLKTQVINGEHYPVYWKSLSAEDQAALPMYYPADLPEALVNKLFALGHPRQNFHPGLMLLTTVFTREHNLVCDGLKARYPQEDDTWLFNTARKILVGELLKMVINDYIQHINPEKSVSQFYFDPGLLKHIPTWNSNPENHRIAEEFGLLYRWHSIIPDAFIDHEGTHTPVPNTFWNSTYLTTRGVNNVVRAAVKQPVNRFGANWSPDFMNVVDISGVRQARDRMKLQSFAAYAKRFETSVPTTWNDIHSDPVVQREFQQAYNSVDEVEFFVGIHCQEVHKGIFPTVLTSMVLAHAMHGIFSNSLCQDGEWTKTTFDPLGYGFDHLNNTSVPQLFARTCPGLPFPVAFEH